MSPERRRREEELYQAALKRAPGERAAFLAEACAGDEELRREVAARLEPQAGAGVTAGTQIGPYRIEAALGQGGMGVVYRALDTKLNRPVAIKLLSDEVADAAARRRFQREAQTASSLNHPHLLTVHDAGEFEGRQYLVTEFIDGGTLKEWARAEKRDWRQIVELLVGVADGLATAHAAGILHRDIKPENVLVTKSGYAKLADFGLAKLEERQPEPGTVTRTLTEDATRPGAVVGTIAYMAPEQAAGRPVDARSDIFSFGVVLYEMFAGRRPFAAGTSLELLQTIIHAPAPPLSDGVPQGLRALVEKALEKDPAERYQTMGELVVDLRRALRTGKGGGRRTRARWWIPAACAVAATAAGVAYWGAGLKGTWHNPLEGATFTRLTDFVGFEADGVISPDGNYVTFLSDRDGPIDVWVLQVASGQFRNLSEGKVPLLSTQVRVVGFTPDGSRVTIMTKGANAGDLGTSLVATLGGPVRFFLAGLSPAWSPDGRRLAFQRVIENRDQVFVADGDGSHAREAFPEKAGEHNHFLAWAPSGRYVYTARSTKNIQEADMWRVAAAGGEPERLTHHNAWVGCPELLDENTLLYVAIDENGAGPWLYAMDPDRRAEHRLNIGIEQYTAISVSQPAAGRRRRLVATVSNATASLWSAPIGDTVAPESAASAFPVPSAQVSSPRFGPDYLLYLSSRELADGLWKLKDGAATELWKASDGAVLAPPAISPDGQQVAISALKGGRAGLHVLTADGASPRPVATSVDVTEAPSWSPDGKTLAVAGYDDKGPGLFLAPADGGTPVRIYDKLCYLPVWSPDGHYILFAEYFQGPLMRVRGITPEGKEYPVPEIRMTRTGSRAAMSSPYRFLPNGKFLVLLDGEWRKPQFWLVNLENGERRPLTDLHPGQSTRSFDVSRDGKRILFDRVMENSHIVLIELQAR